MDDSTESGNFPVRACLPLIQKDSTTNMHGLTVYVKEGLPFIGDLSLENSADPYVFNCLYFNQCLTFFLPIDHLLSLRPVFDSISSNIDEVLSIKPSANVFVFGGFNVHHKDWLTCSGGTDRPSELWQMTLLRCLTFLLGTLTITVLLFWIYLFLRTLVFVL